MCRQQLCFSVNISFRIRPIFENLRKWESSLLTWRVKGTKIYIFVKLRLIVALKRFYTAIESRNVKKFVVFFKTSKPNTEKQDKTEKPILCSGKWQIVSQFQFTVYFKNAKTYSQLSWRLQQKYQSVAPAEIHVQS